MLKFPYSQTSSLEVIQVICIILFFPVVIIVNGMLAYQLFTKKDKHKQGRAYIQTILISFSPVFWALIYFLGFLIAGGIIFPVTLFLLSGFVYYLLQRYAKKTALYFLIMTMIVTLLAISFNFEETYCVKKGDQAAANNPNKMTKATAADEKALGNWGVKKGQGISIAFRVHMLCHQTFSWSTALQETYLR